MRILLIFVSMCLFTPRLSAQIEATTSDGKKVLLRSDSTWTYIHESSGEKTNLGCSEIIEDKMDKVTGKSTRQLKEPLKIGTDDYGFAITLFSTNNIVVLAAATAGASPCIDKDGKTNILFRDGSRMELVNMDGFNCKGLFVTYLGGRFKTKTQLKQLQEKEIETLRVWTKDGYIEKGLDKDQSEKIKAAVVCLSNQ